MSELTPFILNHWPLWAALFIVLLFLILNELLDKKARPGQVSPQGAVQLINDAAAVVVDLRTVDNFEKGHIIDALHCTEETLFTKKFEKYQKNPVILIANQDMQASKIAIKLRQHGFSNIALLKGGLTAWKNADLPLVKGK